ncbi:hypothetical protein C0995_007636 [Termitomyces sp. Mi166|nr:hypothetical protein C0995_007636 [Termitomyces sp. Mi166\
MIVIGGYTMTFEDAKAWALRRYPGINIYDDDLIPHIIQTDNNKLEDSPQKLTFISCLKNRYCFVIFVTHLVDDPTATVARFKRFRPSEADMKFKETFFPGEEAREFNAVFATICDPDNRGY